MRLSRDERGQRDQIDHFRPLVVDLRATNELMHQILDRRIEAAALEVHSGKWSFVRRERSAWQAFFEGETVMLPTSQETRSWSSFLIKSARERPRDIIQLVGKLADTAKKNGRERIASLDAEIAMRDYSAERVRDSANELAFDCPQLEEMIRSFAGLDFELDFERLRKHINTLPSRFGIQVRGRAVSSSDDESFLQMLSVLFEAGFINAKVPDLRQPKDFRHINFPDDPHLVRKSRWNDLQSSRWEVHPAFRSFLLGIAADKRSRG
jgi:hypothetical protein